MLQKIQWKQNPNKTNWARERYEERERQRWVVMQAATKFAHFTPQFAFSVYAIIYVKGLAG
jgi:hypothetical protein